jgi:hypothetical protein
VTAHDAEMVVDVKDVHLHPEDSTLVGRSVDEKTTYVMRLSGEELRSLVEREGDVYGHACPRCDFEDAMSVMVYAGEWIREHFDADTAGQLTVAEVAIVDLARAWAADDAISRCLDSADDC